jgi:hypothetical protein
MGDKPSARPMPIQDSTTQKDNNKHPCRKRDSNPRSQRPSDQGLRFRLRGHCDRPYRNVSQYNYVLLYCWLSPVPKVYSVPLHITTIECVTDLVMGKSTQNEINKNRFSPHFPTTPSARHRSHRPWQGPDYHYCWQSHLQVNALYYRNLTQREDMFIIFRDITIDVFM